MKHRIEYQLTWPGGPREHSEWICTRCNRGPFTPAVVALGRGLDIRIITAPMYRKWASWIKAQLNLNHNRADYYLLAYEDLFLLQPWRAKVIDFKHPALNCYER